MVRVSLIDKSCKKLKIIQGIGYLSVRMLRAASKRRETVRNGNKKGSGISYTGSDVEGAAQLGLWVFLPCVPRLQ